MDGTPDSAGKGSPEGRTKGGEEEEETHLRSPPTPTSGSDGGSRRGRRDGRMERKACTSKAWNPCIPTLSETRTRALPRRAFFGGGGRKRALPPGEAHVPSPVRIEGTFVRPRVGTAGTVVEGKMRRGPAHSILSPRSKRERRTDRRDRRGASLPSGFVGGTGISLPTPTGNG